MPPTPVDPSTVTPSPTKQGLKPRVGARDRAIMCARVIADDRATDVVVLDMTEIVKWVDYLVIGTGASKRQLCAMADDVERTMEEVDDYKIGVEGYDKGEWVVVDFADVVVHVFSAEKRAYYELENLWGDAKRVEWQRPDQTP
jgi:ribosome-associated protein